MLRLLLFLQLLLLRLPFNVVVAAAAATAAGDGGVTLRSYFIHTCLHTKIFPFKNPQGCCGSTSVSVSVCREGLVSALLVRDEDFDELDKRNDVFPSVSMKKKLNYLNLIYCRRVTHALALPKIFLR